MKGRMAVAALIALVTDGAAAQVRERVPSPVMTDVVVSEGQPGGPVMRASTVVETRITPGRPYSAEATTEPSRAGAAAPTQTSVPRPEKPAIASVSYTVRYSR